MVETNREEFGQIGVRSLNRTESWEGSHEYIWMPKGRRARLRCVVEGMIAPNEEGGKGGK